MVKYSEVFTFTDQLTTCPYCGARTEMFLEISESPNQAQIHKCLSVKCGFEFTEVNDN